MMRIEGDNNASDGVYPTDQLVAPRIVMFGATSPEHPISQNNDSYLRSIPMHPPFFHTDHRSVVHTPHFVSHHNGLRRTTPVALPMSVSHLVDNPHIPVYLAQDVPAVSAQTPRPVILQAVPPPTHNSLRDVFGRWLIRMGQRIIFENHPG